MNLSLKFPEIQRYASLAIGRTSPINEGQRRYVRVIHAVLAAFLGKGVALLVGFVSVPLTVNYLGAERYGVWITISTMLAWFTVADIGLNNSLTNMLSEAYATHRSDLAQRCVATVFWMMCGISMLLSIALAVIWRWVNWSEIFHLSSSLARIETPAAIGLAFAIFVLNFPFTILPKIHGAYQEGGIANYWSAFASILSLIALVIMTNLQGGLIALVCVYVGIQLVVNVVWAFWLFGYWKPFLRPSLITVQCDILHRLCKIGSMFFIVQIAGMLLYQANNFIIAYFLGASQATPYSVTWRLFTYTTMLQIIILPALWPAYAEAFARKDIPWIIRTFRIEIVANTLLTGLLASLLAVFGISVIQRWAGPAAVPPQSLLAWMAVWSVIFVIISSMSCILNSSSRLHGQTIYATLTAISNIYLSIVFVKSAGITGAIAATVISFLIFNFIPSSIETYLVLKQANH